MVKPQNQNNFEAKVSFEIKGMKAIKSSKIIKRLTAKAANLLRSFTI